MNNMSNLVVVIIDQATLNTLEKMMLFRNMEYYAKIKDDSFQKVTEAVEGIIEEE